MFCVILCLIKRNKVINIIKQEEYEDSGFEERADYINYEDIIKWNVDITYFSDIQKKLIGKGSKVLVGPRGTGKTHQMIIAFNSCLEDEKKPLAVYVSFNRYYYLEPLLSRNPAAIKVFHTWVLCRIILACNYTLSRITGNEVDGITCEISKEKLEKFISQSEKNIQQSWHDEIIQSITLQYTLNFITKVMQKCRRKRVVLFLDDAALTLTKEYMIEFFDIFRSLKTVNISPKASVYPGTTEYGPRFHLKQDGDPFNLWFNPEGEEYLHFIDQLCEKRFGTVKIEGPVKELLKYASFGNPRAFITLLRDYEDNALSGNVVIQRIFNSIIDTRCKLLKDEYLSIKQKLTQYSTIIDTGWEFFDTLINEVTHNNKRLNDEKQTIIGLNDNSDLQIGRMIKFLIEAGLLYELTPVKHGENREYKRYILHFLFLLQKKAFSTSRGFNITEIVAFLKRKNTKHPLRKDNIYSILNHDALSQLKLDLPSCTNCGANRLSENQKFCHACGKELVSKSSFEKCMQLTIDELPLTEWQKEKIKRETSLKTVKDFVSRVDIGDELIKPYGFGKKRAEKISNTINKFIEEFLA